MSSTILILDSKALQRRARLVARMRVWCERRGVVCPTPTESGTWDGVKDQMLAEAGSRALLLAHYNDLRRAMEEEGVLEDDIVPVARAWDKPGRLVVWYHGATLGSAARDQLRLCGFAASARCVLVSGAGNDGTGLDVESYLPVLFDESVALGPLPKIGGHPLYALLPFGVLLDGYLAACPASGVEWFRPGIEAVRFEWATLGIDATTYWRDLRESMTGIAAIERMIATPSRAPRGLAHVLSMAQKVGLGRSDPRSSAVAVSAVYRDACDAVIAVWDEVDGGVPLGSQELNGLVERASAGFHVLAVGHL